AITHVITEKKGTYTCRAVSRGYALWYPALDRDLWRLPDAPLGSPGSALHPSRQYPWRLSILWSPYFCFRSLAPCRTSSAVRWALPPRNPILDLVAQPRRN